MAKVRQPNISPIADGVYQLVETYTYQWKSKGTTWKIIIPKGYKSDGCSVPRIAWTLSGITPDGLIRSAAILHDWLYDHAGRLPHGSFKRLENGVWIDTHTTFWKRKEADQFFANVMKASGVSKFKRRIAYLAVRMGGWTGWKKV